MVHDGNLAAQPTFTGSSFETVRRNISKAARSSSIRRPAILQVKQNTTCRSTIIGVCMASLLKESIVASKVRKASTSQMVSVDIMDLETFLTVATSNCQVIIQYWRAVLKAMNLDLLAKLHGCVKIILQFVSQVRSKCERFFKQPRFQDRRPAKVILRNAIHKNLGVGLHGRWRIIFSVHLIPWRHKRFQPSRRWRVKRLQDVLARKVFSSAESSESDRHLQEWEPVVAAHITFNACRILTRNVTYYMSITDCACLVIVKNCVQIFNPYCVDWTIQNDPIVLVPGLCRTSPKDREYTVSPISCDKAGVIIECTTSALLTSYAAIGNERGSKAIWPVDGSSFPNICDAVMAFGFILETMCLIPIVVRADATLSIIVDFPAFAWQKITTVLSD